MNTEERFKLSNYEPKSDVTENKSIPKFINKL